MANDRIIQGLWIGEALSNLERLSIRSFLAHGHDFHLYTYQAVDRVPPGTVMKDAREILPESRIFRYWKHPSYAGFANFFRYKLLSERGGWWVDTDVICLRPFDFADDHVFGAEWTSDGGSTPSSGFLKAPAGSDALAFAWARCLEKDPAELTWGETGPRLVAEAIRRYDLDGSVQNPDTFAPLPYQDWERVLDPLDRFEIPSTSHAIHLWNEMWRRNDRDKDASYHPDCLYERLKARYPAESVV
jgi:mannosyltransferase OCH1-like enzyme